MTQTFEQLLAEASEVDRAQAVSWIHRLHEASEAKNAAAKDDKGLRDALKLWLATAGETELVDGEHGEGVRMAPGSVSRWVDYSALSDAQIAYLVRNQYLGNSITAADVKRLEQALDATALDCSRHVHEGRGDERLLLFRVGS